MTVLVGIAGQSLVGVGVNAVLVQAQLGGVLDRVDALVIRHGGEQRLAQRRLAAAHRCCHHHVRSHSTGDGLDQHAAQLGRRDAEIVETDSAGHVGAQHHVRRAGDERLGVEPPTVPDAHVKARIQLVEALRAVAGIAGHEPHRLDEIGVGGKRRRATLDTTAGVLDQHGFPAANLELLDIWLGQEVFQGISGSARGVAAPYGAVGTVEPLGYTRRGAQRTAQAAHLPVCAAGAHSLDAHDPVRAERRRELTRGIAPAAAGARKPERDSRHCGRGRRMPSLRSVTGSGYGQPHGGTEQQHDLAGRRCSRRDDIALGTAGQPHHARLA